MIKIIVDKKQEFEYKSLEGRSDKSSLADLIKYKTNTLEIDSKILSKNVKECIEPLLEAVNKIKTNEDNSFRIEELEVNLAFNTEGNLSILSSIEAVRSNNVGIKVKIKNSNI